MAPLTRSNRFYVPTARWERFWDEKKSGQTTMSPLRFAELYMAARKDLK